MSFRITELWFDLSRRRGRPALFDQDAIETPPAPFGQRLRRWGALLALAGLALSAASPARPAVGGPPALAVIDVSRTERPEGSAVSRDADATEGRDVASGMGAPGDLPAGASEDTASVAPWEGGVVEADGKPLPTAPPPGPVPVTGIPAVASAKAAKTDLVPADRRYLRPILVRYAQENGLPADLVMALAWVESSWRRSVVSDVGAVGVMQLMPDTVEFVSKRLLGLRSNLDPKNATSNVRMGTRYLKHLLALNKGNVRQALIAYNQGLTSLRTNGSYGMAERYADRVLALRPRFRSA